MRFIVPVVSGKGGVGKSTVAVNLAVALSRLGLKVGLLDSDFYGPSVPTLMGGGKVIPNHNEQLVPPEKFGVKYMSLGFFLQNPDDAVIWRGPMFNKALNQMFSDVDWGEIDICVIDMPPGTGDAQLSLAQNVQVTGAVVVTTPQEVALADVRKAMNMLGRVNVPILGVVENMAGYVDSAGKRIDIFGSGGGEKVARQFGVSLLASIPIDPSVREGGDTGRPVALDQDSAVGQIFASLAREVWSRVESAAQPAVNILNS